MKDVTLNNGTVMTDGEYIQKLRQYGLDDTLTEFVATRQDLKLLAAALVKELLGDEFYGSKSCRIDYTAFRLNRVLDFLSETEVAEIQEKLRLGREKVRGNAGAQNTKSRVLPCDSPSQF